MARNRIKPNTVELIEDQLQDYAGGAARPSGFEARDEPAQAASGGGGSGKANFKSLPAFKYVDS